MKAFLRTFAFALALLQSAVHAEEIRGTIFIVTEGQTAIRLRLVNVELFTHSDFDKSIAESTAKAKPVLKYLNLAVASNDATREIMIPEAPTPPMDKRAQATGLRDYVNTIEWHFGQLPRPLQTAKTDVSGNFEFEDVPLGHYVLVARASRSVGERSEYYHWAVIVRAGAKKVELANDNLCTGDSRDSALHAEKADILAIVATQGRGPKWLESFVMDRRREIFEQAEANEAAEFRKTPGLAQKRAAEKFPDLAKAGSALNNEFLRRHRAYAAENPKFLENPRWPVILAEECADALKSASTSR